MFLFHCSFLQGPHTIKSNCTGDSEQVICIHCPWAGKQNKQKHITATSSLYKTALYIKSMINVDIKLHNTMQYITVHRYKKQNQNESQCMLSNH